jgi:hypothetical protein
VSGVVVGDRGLPRLQVVFGNPVLMTDACMVFFRPGAYDLDAAARSLGPLT